jgi:indole-3-acetate monooxygenase
LVGRVQASELPFYPAASVAEYVESACCEKVSAVALVRAARAWLHTLLQQAWEATVSRGEVSFEARADLLLAAANVTRGAAAAVNIVYTLAGDTVNYRHSSLQQSLRDVHVVTQHIVMSSQRYEVAGRSLLELQPLQPFILL